LARRIPTADFDRDAWLEQKQAKLRAAHDMLEQGVESFRDSDQYRAYLEFNAQHARTFSFKNTLLIYSQMPTASLVMGFRQWKGVGRSVKKGERGLTILAPSTYKKTNGEAPTDGNEDTPEEVGVRFITVSVFDVSQTEGEPVPEILRELKGTSEEIQELRSTLTRIFGDEGYEVEEQHLVGNHYGYINPASKKVVTREGVEDMQALKTLLHEKAHKLLHVDAADAKDIPRDQRELEAESVAFIAMRYYGFDTSEYSFAYVTSWTNADTKKIAASADRIHHAASSIIDAMEQARETRQLLTPHDAIV
jgi:antirestriction protein ArdC